MTIKKCKVLIIGSGPAGYTAAIYAARAALKPVLVEGYEPGGQLTVTTDVENWPGFEDVIQGPWLMEQMQKQAKKVGTELAVDYINEVDFSKRPFTCVGDSGTTYKADAVIVATGAQAKWLGLESETKFRGYGVSGCATCDGFFYKNKDVAVIGGGNTAVEEALYLTTHAKKVTLIHRKDKLRCEKILEEKLLKHPKVKVIWDTVLEEVIGNENPKSVTSLKLKNVKTDKETDLDVDGVFVAIGHKPQTDIFKGQLDMDKEGYLKAKPGTTQTNVAGIFAAGDVQDKVYRQAVTAAGQGCMAALDVVRFLED
jgi:thioredoxin reductase (NADPH)